MQAHENLLDIDFIHGDIHSRPCKSIEQTSQFELTKDIP